MVSSQLSPPCMTERDVGAVRQTPSWHLSCPDSLWPFTILTCANITPMLWEKKAEEQTVVKSQLSLRQWSVMTSRGLSTLLSISSFAPGDNCEELYHVCCWGLPCHQALLPSGCGVLADEATESFSLLLLVAN